LLSVLHHLPLPARTLHSLRLGRCRRQRPDSDGTPPGHGVLDLPHLSRFPARGATTSSHLRSASDAIRRGGPRFGASCFPVLLYARLAVDGVNGKCGQSSWLTGGFWPFYRGEVGWRRPANHWLVLAVRESVGNGEIMVCLVLIRAF
jgi:hypothetical protein